jgi:hypothetical protein
MPYTTCPNCRKEMEVERVHNGVCYVWHGIHCGWGQAYFADNDVYFKSMEDKPRRTL